jgi:glycogen synthase
MSKKLLSPDYIFESSWEVCNKVGGIYTVLSTRAKTLTEIIGDNLIFIGPDFWTNENNPLFKESKSLFALWKKSALNDSGLKIRIGRWQIPGKPIAVLVDFQPFFEKKNDIYTWAWNNYHIDSLHAYGDYDEASMFSYAAGRVVESFYRFHGLNNKDKVVYQAHEWMTALGALYVQYAVPEIATIFTTHATSIGRSIAGNDKPLYDYLSAYNGDQMAVELNMQSKHSVEKAAAHYVDCFTTVSDITARECEQLLDKKPAQVLMNGFEDDFVPKLGSDFDKARKKARKKIFDVANTLLGEKLNDDTLVVSVGGRYEYKNKGIDIFVDSMNRLRNDSRVDRTILALVLVPAWMKEARTDLVSRIKSRRIYEVPVGDPRITHVLNNQDNDNILNQMNWLDMFNRQEDKVKLIFVPCYLDGKDGIFNMHYYDLLIGMDLCIYPSYYEPWGYTPTESVAFHVPCITTDLAGFGLWANKLKGGQSELEDGVKTIHRSDNNAEEVSEDIKETVIRFMRMDNTSVEQTRKNASKIAEKALWKHFIKYYFQAYDIALRNAKIRNKVNNK